MIEREYANSTNSTQQTLSIVINASPEKVFDYLTTTDGISSWFPELSFKNSDTILFSMGNGQVEPLEVYVLNINDGLSFDWFTGKVTFHLSEYDGKTKLIFNEVVPNTFQNIARDFAGWDKHMKNIKNIIETGSIEEMDMDAFKKQQHKIKTELAL